MAAVEAQLLGLEQLLPVDLAAAAVVQARARWSVHGWLEEGVLQTMMMLVALLQGVLHCYRWGEEEVLQALVLLAVYWQTLAVAANDQCSDSSRQWTPSMLGFCAVSTGTVLFLGLCLGFGSRLSF